MKRFLTILLFIVTLALWASSAMAQYNATWRNIQCQAIASALQTGATFQVWNATTVPADANVTVTGTLLTDGTITGSNVTCNTTTSVLTIGGLVDTAINATGAPNILRIIDDGGARVQYTAKMAAAAGTAQLVITDSVNASATELLQNRPFSASISVQY